MIISCLTPHILIIIFTGREEEKGLVTFGRELNSNPAGFATLSGKLDAIQHLKLQAKEMREDEKEHAKEVSLFLH